jgi:hypothetical protein
VAAHAGTANLGVISGLTEILSPQRRLSLRQFGMRLEWGIVWLT